MDFLNFDYSVILYNSVHLVIAYVLTLPLGWNREQSDRHFGLRTFPLVAVVTCGFMLVGISVIDSTGGEARVIQGIIAGIGFIGGGAILADKDRVHGTATAASIWNTGAIGLSVAFNRFEIAILLSFLNFVTLVFFKRVKEEISDADDD